MTGQFSILTVSLPLFEQINNGEHEMSLAKVKIENKFEIGQYTIFEYAFFDFNDEHQKKAMLEHSRRCAYEELITQKL